MKATNHKFYQWNSRFQKFSRVYPTSVETWRNHCRANGVATATSWETTNAKAVMVD